MILETDEERKAFKFICDYASDKMGNAGCNDLDSKEEEWTKDLRINTDDLGDYTGLILYDFDIIQWLQEQIREIKNG